MDEAVESYESELPRREASTGGSPSVLTFAALTSVLLSGWAVWVWTRSGWSRAEIGQLGDFIGGIAGGAGLLGMVVALALQMRELRYQREELRLTRKEMRAQTRVLDAQADEAHRHAGLMQAQLQAAFPVRMKLEVETESHAARRRVTLALRNVGKGVSHIRNTSIVLYNDQERLSRLRESGAEFFLGDPGTESLHITKSRLSEGMSIGAGESRELAELHVDLAILPDIEQMRIVVHCAFDANVLSDNTRRRFTEAYRLVMLAADAP